MGDSERALALAVEAVPEVAAATLYPMNFMTDYQHDPNLTYYVGEYKTNTRSMRRNARAATRYDVVTVNFDLDSTEVGLFLASAFRAPGAAVAHVFTFLSGGSSTPTLTVAWMEGLTNLWWQGVGSKVSKLDIKIAANTVAKCTATIHVKNALPMTSPPSWTFTPPPDNSPFMGWQTVISHSGVAAKVITADISIDNHYDPLHDTPVTAPGASAEVGSFPDRFTDGKWEGNWNVNYIYTVDANSSFYRYRHNIPESWTVSMTDAPNLIPLGYTPTVLFTMPNETATKGKIDRSQPNVLQQVSGIIGNDEAGLGHGIAMSALLTNGATTMYAGT